jgi:hypothetical protein
MPDWLMRKVDVRRWLAVSPQTLDKLIGSGALPVVRVSERCVRIRASAVESYLASRTEPGAGAVNVLRLDRGPRASRVLPPITHDRPRLARPTRGRRGTPDAEAREP